MGLTLSFTLRNGLESRGDDNLLLENLVDEKLSQSRNLKDENDGFVVGL